MASDVRQRFLEDPEEDGVPVLDWRYIRIA
jgi:hypothetical protein